VSHFGSRMDFGSFFPSPYATWRSDELAIRHAALFFTGPQPMGMINVPRSLTWARSRYSKIEKPSASSINQMSLSPEPIH
jgi:hypothetical protein